MNTPESQERIREIEESGKQIGEHFQNKQWRQFEVQLNELEGKINNRFQTTGRKEAMTQPWEKTLQTK